MKDKRVQIKYKIDPETTRRLEAIIHTRGGYGSPDDVINESVFRMYNQLVLMPTTENLANPLPVKPIAPDNRGRPKSVVRQEEIRTKKLEILNALDGTLAIEKDSGKEIVRFYQYRGTKRDLQEIPLAYLTKDLVENQYYPSRRRVEELQKSGAVDYDVSDIL